MSRKPEETATTKGCPLKTYRRGFEVRTKESGGRPGSVKESGSVGDRRVQSSFQSGDCEIGKKTEQSWITLGPR